MTDVMIIASKFTLYILKKINKDKKGVERK
jgi:hypothetical protein